MPTDTVPIGTPITTQQATRAIFRMIHSPIVGDVNLDSSPGYTLQRIKRDSYNMLSSGERKLVDIAEAIWTAPSDQGARISVLGGLDRTLRRKVLLVLAYLYLGRDVHLSDLGSEEFAGMFL